MCLLVNPLVTLHFLLSPPTGARWPKAGGSRPRSCIYQDVTGNQEEEQDKTSKSQPIGYSREWRSRQQSCHGDKNTSIFLAGTAKPRPTSKARRVSLMDYSTSQKYTRGWVEEWQSCKDSAAGSTLLPGITKAKPTTTIPCHTPWPRLLQDSLARCWQW